MITAALAGGPRHPGAARRNPVPLRYRGGDDTAAAGDLSRFADQPSAWAAGRQYAEAAGAGIITGKGRRQPGLEGAATRAETAQMLRGLLD